MKLICTLLIAVLILNSCKKNVEDEEFPGNTNLVSAVLVASLSKSDLDAKATKSGFGTYASLTKYDVDYYRIIYKTVFKSKEIQVSGLLGIPKNTSKTPSLLSAHHAEITRFADAPSNFPVSFGGMELFASAGFIEMIPDYIGLGVSSNIPHPYYVRETSALTVIDMIKATKSFLDRKKIAYDPKLFLTGFAEGGYVTSAAQYVIETDNTHQLNALATAEGGGILDIGGYFQLSYNSPTISSPFFLATLIESYKNTYDLTEPYSYFLKSPYAEKMSFLFDGTKSTQEINSELTSSRPLLVTPEFWDYGVFVNLNHPFSSKLFLNRIPHSTRGYVPGAKTRFYFDTFDAVTNTLLVIPYDNFSSAQYSHIDFKTVDRSVPSTGQPMLLDAMKWFISLDN